MMNKLMSKPKLLLAAGTVVALGTGIGVGNTAISSAAESPGFTIDGSAVVANGTGCPQGSVQTLVSPDETALTVAFSEYVANAGPGFTARDRRKGCSTTVPIRVPEGFTWGVTTATYRGYAELTGGTKAYQGARYFFQGGSTGALESEVRPDESGNWEVTDKTATVAWAPCDTQTNLVVTSSLRLVPGAKVQTTSTISMDTEDISLRSQNIPAMTFGLDFKRCR